MQQQRTSEATGKDFHQIRGSGRREKKEEEKKWGMRGERKRRVCAPAYATTVCADLILARTCVHGRRGMEYRLCRGSFFPSPDFASIFFVVEGGEFSGDGGEENEK